MNIMIDIETLGVSPRAPLLSIGACSFDQHGIHKKFYTAVIPNFDTPYEPDANTICWWMRQSEEARAVFNDPNAISIHIAMVDFTIWVSQIKFENKSNVKIWAKPPRFDITILENAMTTQPCPWGHRDVLDMRTLTHVLDPESKQAPAPTGTAHNALDDAIYQAKYVRTLLYPPQLELSL